MLPLGLISNLRSTSLVSFCICALTSWQSLQKGRASHSLAQWSISANYIPAVFAFWQHLYSIHIDPAVQWLLNFSYCTPQKNNLFYIMIPDTHTYIFNNNKIARVTLTKCILIFFVLFNSIFEYTILNISFAAHWNDFMIWKWVMNQEMIITFCVENY